ncbi:hypothetical protein BOX15_Mlig029119g1, partial [Macrostomum lignano]
ICKIKIKMSQQPIRVHGRILLPSNPASLPTPSYLTVGLSDTSLMDAPAVSLAKSSAEISESYNRSGAAQALTYSLSGATRQETGCMPNAYSVSATINVGWKPTDQEWVRKGDYLVDTTHNVPVIEGQTEYEMDISLIHYN